MEGTQRVHLQRLGELAANFDADERQVVLSAIPKEEIKAYLKKIESEGASKCVSGFQGLL